MMATGREVSFLLREMMWMPLQARLSILRERVHENTILCSRRRMLRYPSLAKGEDAPVAQGLRRRYPVVYVDQPELYLYVAHGKNTWEPEHMETMWRSSTDRFEGTDYNELLRRLISAYPIEPYRSYFASSAE